MRIVVQGTNWIGDAVMSIPALRFLREARPEAHITLFTRPWAEGVFGDCDFIDEILPSQSGTKTKDLATDAKTLRKGGFDAGLLLTNSFRTAFVLRLAGIRERVGYANEGRSFLLTRSFEFPDWKNQRHESGFYLNLVESWTGKIAAETPSAVIDVSQARRDEARLLLSEIGAAQPIVALGVGSQNSRAKRWPTEHFAEVAKRMIEERGASIVLLGSESEHEVAERVLEICGGRAVNLCGKTTLSSAVGILATVDLFISNDMGLAHIAAATQTPSLTIFGPTNPLTTKPFGGEIIKEEGIDCAPCMLRDCPIDHRCMTRITASEVFEKACGMLSERFLDGI
ncbi:MAG: lipopolysaccharide heptosyltransferase II [Pyrinomonadaceae bacterium]